MHRLSRPNLDFGGHYYAIQNTPSILLIGGQHARWSEPFLAQLSLTADEVEKWMGNFKLSTWLEEAADDEEDPGDSWARKNIRLTGRPYYKC